MTPGIHTAMSVGNVGLSLLNSSLAWWDARPSGAITEVDNTVDLDPMNWTVKNLTVSSSVSDPDGGTSAYRFTGDVSGNNYINANGSDTSTGYYRLRGKVKPYDTDGTYSRLYATANQVGFINLLSPSQVDQQRNEDIAFCQIDSEVHGFSFVELGDGWWEFDSEFIANNTLNQFPFRFLLHKTTTTPETLIDVYGLQLVHKRASGVASRIGGTPLSQSTHTERHSITPDSWFNGPALVGARTGIEEMTASVAVGAGSCLFAGTVQPLRREFTGRDTVAELRGATARIKLEIVGGDAGALGQYGWTFTDDTGTETSGLFGGYLPAVPVCVALYYDGSSLRLFVDGKQIGSNAAVSGTTTITDFAVLGRESQVLWTSWAIRTGTHSNSEVSALSLTLRSEAGLPDKYLLWHNSGQSNSTHMGNENQYRANSGIRLKVGNAFSKREWDGGSDTAFPWTRAGQPYWWVFGDKRNSFGGNIPAFLLDAQDNNDFGHVIVSSGRGGTGIEAWMSGSDMYSNIRSSHAAAVAEFGTHLIRPYGFLWTQGEANATNNTSHAGGYQGALEELIAGVRSDFGTTRVIATRLNTFFDNTALYAADVRTAQDTVASADAQVNLSRSDFDSPWYDTIHYSVWGEQCLGKNLYRIHKGLTPITDPGNP